jgi:HlyD family secretion protein
MGKRRWIIVLAVLVPVAAGAVVYGLWNRAADRAPLEGANLTSVRVSRGDIEVRLSGSGSVAVSARESVRPSEAGTVKTVEVKTGDRVERGQVLATFEGSAGEVEIARLELRLEELRLQLEQAENEFKQLQMSGAEATQIEKARMNLRSVQLNIEGAELDIEEAKKKAAGPGPLVAPISGTVTAVNIRPGDAVSPQVEAFVVTDYDALQLVITVDELDVPKLKEGQEAEIRLDALPGRTFNGVVEDIAMEGTQSGGVATFQVAIRFESADQVRPGMSGTAEIVTASKRDALLLPVEAVQTAGGRYFVLRPASGGGGGEATGAPREAGAAPDRGAGGNGGPAGGVRFPRALENMSAALVPVEIGLYDELRIEIVSGLSEGDEVLIPRFADDSGIQGLRRAVPGGSAGFAPREVGVPGGGGGFQGGGRAGGGGMTGR